MGFEWTPGWRYERLWTVLAEQQKHTLDDSSTLQRDYYSLMALRAIDQIPDDLDGPGVEMLRRWDGELNRESAAGAYFAIWYYRHLRPALSMVLLPEAPELVSDMDSLGVLRLMAEERSRAAITDSLVTAYAETETIFGTDTSRWHWGDLHRIEFKHPMLRLADGELAATMTYPPYPRGGSGNTTNSTSFSARDMLVRAGASYRQVIDVGNWDASTMTNAPGQSGDPRSPFYDNLLKGWAEERAFPLLYSREKVLEHQAIRIELLPKETMPAEQPK